MNTKKDGLFVTIDGPSGSGKTILVKKVANQLTTMGLNVFPTKEPTRSSFGQFVKNVEKKYSEKAFACLVTADRYFHLEKEVLPALRQNKIILSDRYIESSLALQKLDGVSLEFIWAINKQILIPDLSIVITASAETLENRLQQRSSLSRLELTKSRKEELKNYLAAVNFLSKNGFNTIVLDNDTTPLEDNVKKIVEKITEILYS